MEKTPQTNPNYFRDDYQRQGDEFNPPNAKKFHLNAWNKFSGFAKKNGIEVVNCSHISHINCFRKCDLKEELERSK